MNLKNEFTIEFIRGVTFPHQLVFRGVIFPHQPMFRGVIFPRS